ncbi:MAG: formyltransferase family protein, partial [Dehalococcoidales bacterium]|nr:formyltransferase family protein [Dehalococcoidales bacterium]
MRQLIYDPVKSGSRMTIAVFVSGSGTNYREIVARGRDHSYIVFTNRPGCGAVAIARENKHEVIELSHLPYLKDVSHKYPPGNVPRNCPERVKYEQDVCRLLESRVQREPDLICLAGYDQWLSDWMVDRYYPRILNVHPGDTTKGYFGLYWVPSAKAILAGDEIVRSTLFLVDKGEDSGPILVQSRPVNIIQALGELEAKGNSGLLAGLDKVTGFARAKSISDWSSFEQSAGVEIRGLMKNECKNL